MAQLYAYSLTYGAISDQWRPNRRRFLAPERVYLKYTSNVSFNRYLESWPAIHSFCVWLIPEIFVVARSHESMRRRNPKLRIWLSCSRFQLKRALPRRKYLVSGVPTSSAGRSGVLFRLNRGGLYRNLLPRDPA